MHTVALIADGQIDSRETLKPLILRHQRIVAVDGGLVHCHALSLRPDLIVGDFDSCPPALLKEYEGVPKIELASEKDETDLEVAINEELKRGARSITLYGAWGRRIDHSLGNLLLLTRHPGKITLETENETIFAISKSAAFSTFPGQILSLIPLNGPVTGLTTKGLKWELNSSRMDQNFFGISNLSLDRRVEISLQAGILICCINK